MLVTVKPGEQFVDNNEQLHKQTHAFKWEIALESDKGIGVRSVAVWAFNFSKTVITKPSGADTASFTLKVNPQIELVLQCKKGIVADALYNACVAKPKEEMKELASVFFSGIIPAHTEPHTAFRHLNKQSGASMDLVLAYIKVPTSKYLSCINKSGTNGVVVQVAGVNTVTPHKFTRLFSREAAGFQAALQKAKKLGDLACGIFPVNKLWTEWAIRIQEKDLMRAHARLQNRPDQPSVVLKYRFYIDNLPAGTCPDHFTQSLAMRFGWNAMFLEVSRGRSKDVNRCAFLVASADEPPTTVIPQDGSLPLVIAPKETTAKPIWSKIGQESAWKKDFSGGLSSAEEGLPYPKRQRSASPEARRVFSSACAADTGKSDGVATVATENADAHMQADSKDRLQHWYDAENLDDDAAEQTSGGEYDDMDDHWHSKTFDCFHSHEVEARASNSELSELHAQIAALTNNCIWCCQQTQRARCAMQTAARD